MKTRPNTRPTQPRFRIHLLAGPLATAALAAALGGSTACEAADAAPLNPFEQAAAATNAAKPLTALNPPKRSAQAASLNTLERAAQGVGLNPLERVARGGAAAENPLERDARLVREELARQEQERLELARREQERLEIARREQEQRRATEQAAQLAKQGQDSEWLPSGSLPRGQAPTVLYPPSAFYQDNQAYWQSEQGRNDAAWSKYNQDAKFYNNGVSAIRPIQPLGLGSAPPLVVPLRNPNSPYRR